MVRPAFAALLLALAGCSQPTADATPVEPLSPPSRRPDERASPTARVVHAAPVVGRAAAKDFPQFVGAIPDSPTSRPRAIDEGLHRFGPDWSGLANHIAWLLATHSDPRVRDAEEAVRLAEESCQATGHLRADYLDTLAAAYAERGRYEDAIAAARRAKDISRQQGQLELADEIDQRWECYLRRMPHREPTAITFAPASDKHATRRTAHAYVHFVVGQRLDRLARPADALEAYKESLRFDPAFAPALLVLAGYFREQGDRSQAEIHLALAAAAAPDDPDVLWQLAAEARQRGDDRTAVQSYEKIVRQRPEALDAAGELAWMYATQQDALLRRPAEAIRLAERLVAHSHRQRPDLLDTLAAAYAAGGDFARAITFAEEAIALVAAGETPERDALAAAQLKPIEDRLAKYRAGQPHVHLTDPEADPEMLARLAMRASEQNQPFEAIRLYRRALELRPGWSAIVNNLAWLLATHLAAEVRNDKVALQLAQQAIDGAGDSNQLPWLLDSLGAAYASAGRYHDAVQTIDRAISLVEQREPAGDGPLIASLEAMRFRRQLYRAERPYRELLPTVTSPDELLALAELRRGQGRWLECIHCCRTALALKPDYGDAQIFLAWILATHSDDDLRDGAAAVSLATAAACARPDDPEVLFTLAAANAEAGQFETARRTVEAALEQLAPEGPANLPQRRKLSYAQSIFASRRAWRGEVDPSADPEFLVRLAMAAQGAGQAVEAAELMRQALKLRSEWPEVVNNLAWTLATSRDARARDGREAVRLAESLIAAHNSPPPAMLDTLAAAYAEAGRFDDALAAVARAIEREPPSGRLAAGLRARRALYERRQPLRDTPAP